VCVCMTRMMNNQVPCDASSTTTASSHSSPT
jgi:hypothetical protein